MGEVRECPLCCGEATLQNHWGANDHWVECDSLGCELEGPHRRNEPDAINAWNTRPTEEALRAEVERLRELARLARLAIIETHIASCDGAVEGYRPLVGDWAARLYASHAGLDAVVKVIDAALNPKGEEK